ncbi:hypothetical protein ACLKA6_002726 [Drosophila palustris]
MDFFQSGGAEGERIPSELRSAINIALFQAQQTYMTAMDTQLAEYKTTIRQEMLAFMAQIRETVQNIYSGDPEPSEQQRLSTLLELSTALVAGDSVDSLVDKCHNEALKKQQPWESMLAWTSPPLEAAQEDVSDEDVVRELKEPQMAIASQSPRHVDEQKQSANGFRGAGASGCLDVQSVAFKDLQQNGHQWPWGTIMRDSCMLMDGEPKKAVAPQPVEESGVDPVVEALYRPRAGGGSQQRIPVPTNSWCRMARRDAKDRKEQQLVYCPANLVGRA